LVPSKLEYFGYLFEPVVEIWGKKKLSLKYGRIRAISPPPPQKKEQSFVFIQIIFFKFKKNQKFAPLKKKTPLELVGMGLSLGIFLFGVNNFTLCH
jgi:hypothetical protein